MFVCVWEGGGVKCLMSFRSTVIGYFSIFSYIWMLELFTKGRDIIIQMK